MKMQGRPFLDADDAAQMGARLRSTDINVAGRTSGRTNLQTERFTLCHLLAALAQSDRLSFPLRVIHRDKPDFLLVMGRQQIGVEITEAASTAYSAYCALAEREFPDAFLEPALFRPGHPPFSTAELRAILSGGRLVSNGWSGESAEYEWANEVAIRLNKKLRSLQRKDFEKFDRNWLVVYDNLPRPELHMAVALPALKSAFAAEAAAAPKFDRIFVISDEAVVDYDGRDARVLPIPQIWRRLG